MNIRPFQVVLLSIFGFMAILSIILLNSYQSASEKEQSAYGDRVIVWGEYDQVVFNRLLTELRETYTPLSVVEYVQKDPRSFDEDFVNALADGRAPDLLIMSVDKLVKQRSKLQPIPYETLPVRTFRDTYIDAADIVMFQDGVYMIPIGLDPLILYWNRDTFSNKGIIQPPQTWETLVSTIVPTLTERDSRRTIMRSGIALGEYRNIKNAKPILIALALQSGSAMVREKDTRYDVSLNQSLTDDQATPLATSLQFYSSFSNANSPLYSWNRSLPNDLNHFIAGDLAMYFGLASELSEISAKNPNLNFDVALVPQGSTATVRRTYADLVGFAIPRASTNKAGALAVAQLFTGKDSGPTLATGFGLTPARRDALSVGDLNQYEQIAYESAMISRTWLDPDPTVSDDIFSIMVEDVSANRASVTEAASDANSRLKQNY
jgi:multiple sugar transport system substrate-binding protein